MAGSESRKQMVKRVWIDKHGFRHEDDLEELHVSVVRVGPDTNPRYRGWDRAEVILRDADGIAVGWAAAHGHSDEEALEKALRRVEANHRYYHLVD